MFLAKTSIKALPVELLHEIVGYCDIVSHYTLREVLGEEISKLLIPLNFLEDDLWKALAFANFNTSAELREWGWSQKLFGIGFYTFYTAIKHNISTIDFAWIVERTLPEFLSINSPTILSMICQQKREDLLVIILQKFPEHQFKYTSVMKACLGDVSRLGVIFDSMDGETRRDALVNAVHLKHYECVRFLASRLEDNPAINYNDPYLYVMRNKDLEMMQFLHSLDVPIKRFRMYSYFGYDPAIDAWLTSTGFPDTWRMWPAPAPDPSDSDSDD